MQEQRKPCIFNSYLMKNTCLSLCSRISLLIQKYARRKYSDETCETCRQYRTENAWSATIRQLGSIEMPNKNEMEIKVARESRHHLNGAHLSRELTFNSWSELLIGAMYLMRGCNGGTQSAPARLIPGTCFCRNDNDNLAQGLRELVFEHFAGERSARPESRRVRARDNNVRVFSFVKLIRWSWQSHTCLQSVMFMLMYSGAAI